jgi:hypothetical protein
MATPHKNPPLNPFSIQFNIELPVFLEAALTKGTFSY